MKSEMLGEGTLITEITNISNHGIWLFSKGKEFFLPYEEFPWFKEVPVSRILNVQEVTPGHFYWPDLDVDLSLEVIKNPQRFPLKAR